MKIVPNNIVWSGAIRRYVDLVGNDTARVFEDKYRHLERWEIPITHNHLGYSCHLCQGFVKNGEIHKCYILDTLKNMSDIKHYNIWDI